VTAEKVTETYQNDCPPPPPGLTPEEFGCVDGPMSYETTRARTDRTWWLLAPNPFVVLADAAPQIPDEPADRQGPPEDRVGVRARDLDPLGQIGRQVRDLRRPPSDPENVGGALLSPGVRPEREREEPDPVWPTGLAVNVALGGLALWLTSRRLRTPTRNLPRGQRVA
jgi:hypothetical protein